MIIQGSNEPIVLTFDTVMSGIQDFSATLFDKGSGKALKHWAKNNDDISIDNKTITMYLKESETMEFPPCLSVLKIKWLSNDYVVFAEELEIPVKRWEDKTRLTDE